jgi:hypothetical protein
MTTKELTPRQVREREAYDAEKKEGQPISRAMETRAFFRKRAGWPTLRVK